MLSAYWPDPQVEAHERRNAIARTLDRFNNWFNRQAERYKSLIAWALDHRVAVVLIAIGTFVGALALPALGLVGASFFGTEDQSEVIIALETPPGSNLAYTKIKAEEAARIARAHKDIVRFTYTTTGGQTGDVNTGQVYVRLVPKADRNIGAEDFGRQLRKEVGQIGGAEMSVFTNAFGGDQKQIQIQLRGGTIKSMTPAAELLASQVRTVPGAVDIGLSTKGQKPELSVDINRGLAGTLGITVAQVAQSLRPAFAGIKAGDWVDPNDEMREVNVRLAPEARQRASDLEQLPIVVNGPDGRPRTLPLGQIASITQSLGPAQVSHLDSDPVVTVQANTSGRPLTEVMRDINAKIAKITLPPGVRITQGGEAKDQAEVFGRIFSALGIAVMLMYLILVMQFGSFLEPLAIMASLPLSLIGVMLALMITKTTINIMSLIGVILLMGIVAKNAILLIDFAKWAREKDGVPRREALIMAGAIRLRPIMMTTLALIAGMIPVALGIGEGAEFRAPLGRAVIGGVITSTLLTLVVIPTFYEILDEWREWVLTRFGVYTRRTAEHRIPQGVRPVHAETAKNIA
jgi:HAE1 family hydrophobic/amphiphilic exporter-1